MQTYFCVLSRSRVAFAQYCELLTKLNYNCSGHCFSHQLTSFHTPYKFPFWPLFSKCPHVCVQLSCTHTSQKVVPFRKPLVIFRIAVLENFIQIYDKGIHSPKDLLAILDEQSPRLWTLLSHNIMKAGRFTQNWEIHCPLCHKLHIPSLCALTFCRGGGEKGSSPALCGLSAFCGGMNYDFTFQFCNSFCSVLIPSQISLWTTSIKPLPTLLQIM